MSGERDWPAWDAPELQATSDNKRVARYRLHQSWYREHVLQVAPGERHGNRATLVGNTLDPAAVKADPTLNFVNDAAYRAALRRADEVQAEGGTLEVGRLFHNMMSSMTMCFNLFGALGETEGFIDIVQELFDPEAATIDEVICEITPTKALGDKTAFDAMIRYRDTEGNKRFIGIETKYTEPFSQKAYDTDRYREVTADSDWFIDGAADNLVGPATNQLWRGLMLASLTEETEQARGMYLVVSPADDASAIKVTAQVQQQMTDPGKLKFVCMEAIAQSASQQNDVASTSWVVGFGDRYLLA